MKKLDIKYLVNLCVGLAFMFLFRYIPAPEPMTALGMQVVGLFIGTIYLIATVHPAWPALLAIAVLITTPMYSFKTAFASSFGHWVPTFVMSIMLLSYALVKSGLAKRITIWFMTREAARKSPWNFLMLYFGSIFVLGFFLDVFALMAFYFAAIELICVELGYEKRSRFATALVLGTAFMIVTMGASTGFQPHVAIVLGLYNNITGNSIGMFEYTAWSILPLVAIYFMYLGIVKFVIRPDFSRFKNFDPDTLKKEVGPITLQEILIGAIYLLVVLGWFLPGFFNIIGVKNAAVSAFGSYSLVWPAFIGIVLMSIIRVEGKPLMDLKIAARQGVPWHIIFLIVGNMILASALTHADTGFTDWFTMVLQPLTQGASLFTLFLFGAVFTAILTNLGSNSVAGIVAFQLVALLIKDPSVLLLVALPVAFSTRLATMLPSSFVGMGLTYGNDWIDPKKILPYGFLFVVLSIIILMVIGYPMAQLIF